MSAPTPSTPDAVDLVRAKRDGGALADDEIDWLVSAYTRGEVAPEQMSAFLMAVVLRGMERRELDRWTTAMIATGERLGLGGLSRPTVDKHSTGGVGDKVTLPLAPLVASLGVAVPQLSGRALGHTGGTLDKLEAIPGWRATLTRQEIVRQLETVGAVVCAAGPGLVPADRMLYALRDVTGTVESVPLIASSIMSKKLAEGAEGLVLDVKTGAGAFLPARADAEELARTLVRLGTDAGVPTTALLTDMSTPLGLTVGNALEVRESVEVLAGGGPADVVEVTVALAVEMLRTAGRERSADEVRQALRDGRAMDTWEAMIRAQGGDPRAPLPGAREVEELRAPREGVVTGLDAYRVGVAARRLGAGRARPDDVVLAAAGIEIVAPLGARVRAGDVLLRLHTDEAPRMGRALEVAQEAVAVSEAPVTGEASARSEAARADEPASTGEAGGVPVLRSRVLGRFDG